MNTNEQIQAFMLKGNMQEVNKCVKEGLASGMSAIEILNDGLLATMDVLAKRWADGEAFIPEVLIAARCLNSAMEILEPELLKEKAESKGVVVIGTVKSDLHDIGKNLCALMMKAKGFDVIDLGVDIPCETFIEAVKEHKPKFLCLSALLTTSMQNFKPVLDALTAENLRDQVLVAVGGAPVTQVFADEIGADIYCEDAISLSETLLTHI